MHHERPRPTSQRGRGAASAVATLVVTLGVAACGGGSDDEDAGATATTAEATTTSADEATTTSTAHTEDAGATLTDEVPEDLAHSEEGHTQLVELALGLLIEPEELAGSAFTDAGYVPEEGTNGCGVDPDAEHEPDVLVGTALVDPDGRTITEELRVYADTDASAAAFATHRDALDCGTDGAGTTFGEPVDVSGPVGAGAATEVAVTVEDEAGVVISALVADTVLTFRISAPAATPPALDPREVAAFGVGKVLAALEAT